MRETDSSLFASNRDEIQQALLAMGAIYVQEVTQDDGRDDEKPDTSLPGQVFSALFDLCAPSPRLNLASDECLDKTIQGLVGRSVNWSIEPDQISGMLAATPIELDIEATTPHLVSAWEVEQVDGTFVTHHYYRVFKAGLEVSLDPDNSKVKRYHDGTICLTGATVRLIAPDPVEEVEGGHVTMPADFAQIMQDVTRTDTLSSVTVEINPQGRIAAVRRS